MKKRICVFLTFVITLSIFSTGCSSNSSSSNKSASSAAPSSTNGTDAAANSGGNTGGGSTETITLKMTHTVTEDHSHQKASIAFKEYVEEKTDGRIMIDIYPNASLGTEGEQVEAAMLGTLDIGCSSPWAIYNVAGIKEILVFEIPWLLPDRWMMYDAADKSDAAPILRQKMEDAGLVWIGSGDTGSFSFSAKKPIITPDDIAGLKIRIPENPISIKMLDLLGAKAVVVSLGEIYTSLQQGVMDGIFTTPLVLSLGKTYEIAKEVNILESSYNIGVWFMSKDVFDKLSPEDQEIIMEAGLYMEELHRRVQEEDDQKVFENIEAIGGNVHFATDEEIAVWQDSIADMQDFCRDLVGAEIYDIVEEYKENYNK